jgi:hypothetical protein
MLSAVDLVESGGCGCGVVILTAIDPPRSEWWMRVEIVELSVVDLVKK